MWYMWKGEKASSRGSTMEEREMLKNTLETIKNRWGKKAPFIWKAKYGRWGHFPLFWVDPGPKPGPTGPKPSIQENSLEVFRFNFWSKFWFKPSSEPAENILMKNVITFTSELRF
jgi:hypothetical protein